MIAIVEKSGVKNFPYRVHEAFDTSEALMERIQAEQNTETLFGLATCGFAYSEKNIHPGKCIPKNCLKGSNPSLIEAMKKSPRPGTSEIALKLEKALYSDEHKKQVAEYEAEIDAHKFVSCKNNSCLWTGDELELKNGKCPDCGGKIKVF